MELPESFAAICDYAIALGVKSINKLPGCWEQQIDEQWWVAVNAHNDPILCSSGATVPPFSMYVQFNGWPAGIIDAGGGWLAAGAIANEDTLIAAVREAQRKAA